MGRCVVGGIVVGIEVVGLRDVDGRVVGTSVDGLTDVGGSVVGSSVVGDNVVASLLILVLGKRVVEVDVKTGNVVSPSQP